MQPDFTDGIRSIWIVSHRHPYGLRMSTEFSVRGLGADDQLYPVDMAWKIAHQNAERLGLTQTEKGVLHEKMHREWARKNLGIVWGEADHNHAQVEQLLPCGAYTYRYYGPRVQPVSK